MISRPYSAAYYRAHREANLAASKKWQRKHAAELKVYRTGYCKENKARISSRGKAWRDANKLYISTQRKQKRADNLALALAYEATWRSKHRAELVQATRKWQRENPGIVNARNMQRYATKLHATPPWLTAEHLRQIEAFYIEAKRLEAQDGIKRHVDHVYPLQGKTVSGLHVPWNLQILTATDNVKKHNSMPASKIVFGG